MIKLNITKINNNTYSSDKFINGNFIRFYIYCVLHIKCYLGKEVGNKNMSCFRIMTINK